MLRFVAIVLTPISIVLVMTLASLHFASAQPLIPGIHGMSITQGVHFTSVNVTSDRNITANLRYSGTGTTPAVTVIATAMKNDTTQTMGGSQKLGEGWKSPTSVTIKIDGSIPLYDTDLITLVASPTLQSSIGQNTPLVNTETESVKIPSMNSFLDSAGYLHVVGEVQNNTPNVKKFVQVTGTFYDKENQVVATDYTYTKPSDINPNDRAPFEIILTSASIPLNEIDHYRVVASSQ